MAKKNFIPFTQAEEKMIEKIAQERVRVQTRFPILIALSATFGLVSVFYGFEKLIDRVDLFVEHPWILLIIGLSLLAVTGRVYQKLD